MKVCKYCKWFQNDIKVCINENSDSYTDFVDNNDTCDNYEEKDEEESLSLVELYEPSYDEIIAGIRVNQINNLSEYEDEEWFENNVVLECEDLDNDKINLYLLKTKPLEEPFVIFIKEKPESNLIKHMKSEMKIYKNNLKEDETSMIEPFFDEFLSIAKKFNEQGHSGASADYTTPWISNALNKLLSFKTLSPLTGENDEWSEDDFGYDNIKMYQNKRNSSVFKYIYPNGEVKFEQINKIVFVDPMGLSYTNNNSSIPVTFPYTEPKDVYKNVDYFGNETDKELNFRDDLIEMFNEYFNNDYLNENIIDDFVNNYNLVTNDYEYYKNYSKYYERNKLKDREIVFEIGHDANKINYIKIININKIENTYLYVNWRIFGPETSDKLSKTSDLSCQ